MNSAWDNFLINCFILIRLLDEGFIAAHLSSFIFTIYSLLILSLVELYINLLFSSSITKDVCGLFFSNISGLVSLKLYLFAKGSSFDVFLYGKGYGGSVKRLV